MDLARNAERRSCVPNAEPETELIDLASRIGAMAVRERSAAANLLADQARRIEKNGGLKADQVSHLRRALAELQETAANLPALSRLSWVLFRSDGNDDDGDPCWSAEVRRDLRAATRQQRSAWLALLDQTGDECGGQRWMHGVRRAFSRVGQAEFERRFACWTGRLCSGGEPDLSPAGSVLLTGLLKCCECVEDLDIDEGLYCVARARWGRGGDLSWLAAFLRVLAARRADRGFACVEALAINPAIAQMDVIEHLYAGYLGVLATSAAPEMFVRGVDGFPMHINPACAGEQVRIDQILRACRNGRRSAATRTDAIRVLEECLVRECGQRPGSLITALADRLCWLNERTRQAGNLSILWRLEVGRLFEQVLKTEAPLGEDELIRALDADTRRFPGTDPSVDLLQHCEDYVQRKGWSDGLVQALKSWSRSAAGRHGRAARQKASWLLWLEDATPVDLSACWSNRIRVDLRTMRECRRKAWLQLLAIKSSPNAAIPSHRWLRAAKGALLIVGEEEFRSHVLIWCSAFREGGTLRLTEEGRDVLRTLMWYAMAAGDPVVEEALGWFRGARWQSTESLARATGLEKTLAAAIGK